ncbi:hypothetical protein JOD54_001995 [Actinokineospora baliensis]|nr:hypothetical protein [Actinokineospora baliensis]
MRWTCFAWGPYDSRGRTAKQGPKSVALSAQERYDCRSPTQNRSTPSSSWHQRLPGAVAGLAGLTRWVGLGGLTRWAGFGGPTRWAVWCQSNPPSRPTQADYRSSEAAHLNARWGGLGLCGVAVSVALCADRAMLFGPSFAVLPRVAQGPRANQVRPIEHTPPTTIQRNAEGEPTPPHRAHRPTTGPGREPAPPSPPPHDGSGSRARPTEPTAPPRVRGASPIKPTAPRVRARGRSQGEQGIPANRPRPRRLVGCSLSCLPR